MPVDKINPVEYVKGMVRLHHVQPTVKEGGTGKRNAFPNLPVGWMPATAFQKNALLYEWGAIVAKLLMRQGLQYGIGGMYLEFENTASPGDPVAIPDFTRAADEGVEYYNALSGSPDRDYLRVPLVASTLTVTDSEKYPNGDQPTFFAQTAGVLGTHGKTFSDVANSTVFGGALVAFVDEEDYTRDLVFSRFYVAVENQQVKLPTSQIGFEWRLYLQ